MTSLMGFLMLAGIVVNNGILLIDTTNENRKSMPVEEALITAQKAVNSNSSKTGKGKKDLISSFPGV